MSTSKLALFIDYQNVYSRCRAAFNLPAEDRTAGQVSPVKVGRLIATRMPDTRLEKVFVYRGLPDKRKDGYGYAAVRRHTAAWEAQGVEVVTRPLQYIEDEPPREKGIDVHLAIDVVRTALSSDFEVIAIFSGDSDLAPVAEFVFDRYPESGVRLNLVAWQRAPRIILGGDRKPYCHYLRRTDYQTVCDERNYARG